MGWRPTSLVAFVALMIPIAGIASAQEYRTQLFTGYSMYGAAHQGAKAYNGWAVSLARGLSPAGDTAGHIPWFSIVGEASGNYRISGNIHSFLVGPEFSFGDASLRLYSDVMFGVSSVSPGFNGQGKGETGFSLAATAGFEMGPLRLMEFGYQYSRFAGISRNGIRLAAGLVFRF